MLFCEQELWSQPLVSETFLSLILYFLLVALYVQGKRVFCMDILLSNSRLSSRQISEWHKQSWVSLHSSENRFYIKISFLLIFKYKTVTKQSNIIKKWEFLKQYSPFKLIDLFNAGLHHAIIVRNSISFFFCVSPY